MKLLEIWQDFNQSAKIVLTVAAILVAGSMYHSCSTQSNLDKFRKDYDTYKDSVKVTLAHADSLNQWAKIQADSAAKANARADSLSRRIAALNASNSALHKKNDSLVTVVLSDTTVPPQAKEVIVALQTENESLRGQIALDATRDDQRVKAIAQLEGSLATQTKRGDDLQIRLNQLPQGPKSEKLLGIIPLPSRTVSFFVGAAVGVVVHAVLEKSIK